MRGALPLLRYTRTWCDAQHILSWFFNGRHVRMFASPPPPTNLNHVADNYGNWYEHRYCILFPKIIIFIPDAVIYNPNVNVSSILPCKPVLYSWSVLGFSQCRKMAQTLPLSHRSESCHTTLHKLRSWENVVKQRHAIQLSHAMLKSISSLRKVFSAVNMSLFRILMTIYAKKPGIFLSQRQAPYKISRSYLE